MRDFDNTRQPSPRLLDPVFPESMIDSDWDTLDRYADEPEFLLLIVRFWSRVDRSGGPDACWTRYNHGTARPSFDWKGQTFVGARVAYTLAKGSIDPIELQVCHTCDNGQCLNPRHLFLGTLQVNCEDKVRKGRHPRGEKSAKAKLSDADVRAIVAARGTVYAKVLAERYSVSLSTIYHIQQGRKRLDASKKAFTEIEREGLPAKH